ncbi:hypothetical protein LIN78_06395 [Leeia sp. TBRC 13508]|uniref:DUF4034 domain-containing protein n=1 Tax=Leeia speluncae TaxID=2884804 RepID=A0ABS8D4R3_9NEIS|nr:hypothetical protein [Leeia speluncae]MCB6183169.1 hypothetical protein [Leeia speluncae]
MTQEMKRCERLGIDPKWPKQKSIAALLNPNIDGYEEWVRSNILEYITRNDANRSPENIPNRNNVTFSDFDMLSCPKIYSILARVFDYQDWGCHIAYWLRYYQVSQLQNVFWHHRFNSLLTERANRSLKMFNMESAAHMLAVMAMIGWKEEAIYQGYLTHAALNRDYQLALQYREEHRRAQAFILRLFADWVGDCHHQWPAYAYDEPIYETLLVHWRTPNPEDLVPCLLAACDRHTYSSGKETLKKFFDFNTENYLQRVPVEILFLFRLRQWEGLENPILDHPLMAAPFDQLPPVQAVPPLDDLMQGVLKRAREDWPMYDEELSLETLKAAAK